MEKKQKKFLLGLVIVILTSIIATFVITKKYNLSGALIFITFGFVFICLFTVVGFTINRSMKNNRLNIEVLMGLLMAVILLG